METTKLILSMIIALTAIVSAIIALIAAGVAYSHVLEQRRITALTAKYQRYSDLYSILEKNPELLNLYGIEDDLIDRYKISHNIDRKDIIYLLAEFSIDQERSLLTKEKVHELSKHREKMLNNSKVAIIWNNFLCDKLFVSTPFTAAVNAYLSEE